MMDVPLNRCRELPSPLHPSSFSLQRGRVSHACRATLPTLNQVGCLNINMMGDGLGPHSAADYNADTISNYGWMKTVHGVTFPYTNYTDVQQEAVSAWSTLETKYGAPYIPSASVAWDPAPRCVLSDPFLNIGYPWGASWRSTPSEWQHTLELAKGYLDKRCAEAEAAAREPFRAGGVAPYCPPLLLNAWNEWSEGAYLEPDMREGTARLDAIEAVFGNKGT